MTRLRLRVSPGADRAEVVGLRGDAWKVRVRAAPERGRANDAVVRLLADRLQVARSGIEIVSGHVGRDKVVEVRGLDGDEVARLLGGER